MASPTPNLGMTYPAHGGAVNAWDTPLNTDFDTLDSVIGGKYTFSGAGGSAGSTLTQTQANTRLVRISGALTVQDYTITFPAIGGLWIIDNQTTGNFNVKAKVTGSAATSVTCSRGVRTPVTSDGTDLTLAADSCLFAIPYSGNPNGFVAGTAATAYNPPSMVWDYTNNAIYICTTSGVAAAAVWAVPTATVNRGFDTAINLELSATHTGGNLLQVAVKTSAGADPTSGSPVTVEFQTISGSATTGANDVVNITTALSMTTSATGASFGTSSSVPFRVWLALFNNAGSAVLAMRVCTTSSGILPIAEYGVASTTAVSSGATSAGVWYTPSGTTLASKAFRVIGYCEYTSGLVTPGTYSSDPSNTVIFGPGIQLPGQIVQTVINQTGATASGAGTFTVNDTIPTTANGTQFLSTSITLTSPVNLVKADALFVGTNDNTATLYLALFGSDSTNAIAVAAFTESGANTLTQGAMSFTRIGKTLTGFTVRAGGGVVGNTAMNGIPSGSTRRFGGVCNSYLNITEIMG